MNNDIKEISNFSDPEIRREIWRKTTTTVGLVTSISPNGKSNVMACEWAMQIGFNPPTYVIVIGKSHATAEFIKESQEFGLTFISDEQAKLSHVSGSNSAFDMDKIATGLFSLRKGRKIKTPILLDGLLSLECKVIDCIDRERSYLFIGEAIYAEIRNDKSPLLYHAGRYYKLGEQIPKVEN